MQFIAPMLTSKGTGIRIRPIPFLLIGILLLGVAQGCKKDEENEVLLPSNVQVVVTEDSATFGLVNVTAMASNVNFYTITFMENGVDYREENKTGISSHTFQAAGTYGVTVKAHATLDKYTQVAKIIEIADTSDSGGGGDDTTDIDKGYTTPLSYPGYNLIWNDEFESSSLTTSDWNFEIGTGSNGWGNNELQYYRQENVSVADGYLTITAKKENFNSSAYTSSRITTEGKQSFLYGRIDIRAKMPYGQGVWPALWMLGDDFSSVGWPTCGEIDIMEMVGGQSTTDRGDNVVHGTAHWSHNGTHAELNGNTKLGSGDLKDEFHVYSIIWDAQSIKWYFDDNEYHALDIRPAQLSEFHQPFFFIFNVAVGGNWPGNPDGSTVFPQQMQVDYVRVFQK